MLTGLLTAAAVAGLFFWGVWGSTGRGPGPEQYASILVGVLPFGYAFGAGLVASLNPCGFFMLPAFVAYQLGDGLPGASEISPARLGRGFLIGATVTLGFLALFIAAGSGIAAGGHALVSAFPWTGLGIGVGLAIMGLWLLLTGRSLGLAWAGRYSPSGGRTLGAIFLYGVAYGAASLSCSLPVFLVVVGTSLTAEGFIPSLGHFASYALGMGTVVTAVTLGATTLYGAFAGKLRGAAFQAHRASSLFLMGAGAYLVVYWVWLGGALGDKVSPP